MDEYRVLASPRDPDERLLLDPETAAPTYVPASAVEGVDPGNRVRARLDWTGGSAADAGDGASDDAEAGGDGADAAGDDPAGGTTTRPEVVEYEVVDATRFRFRRDVAPLFEAAVDCWETAAANGEAMDARVLRNTDSDPVGVVYVFAEQPGARDLFGEFADGSKPLDPLLARAEAADPPFEAFVLDPTEHRCVVVAIAFDPESRFAGTMRETYE
jgi:hypothetical protein